MQFPEGGVAPSHPLNEDDLEWMNYQHQQHQLYMEYQNQQAQMAMLEADVMDLHCVDGVRLCPERSVQREHRLPAAECPQHYHVYEDTRDEVEVRTPPAMAAHVKMPRNIKSHACRDLPVNSTPTSQRMPLKGILKDTSKGRFCAHQEYEGFSKSQNASHYATLPRNYKRSTVMYDQVGQSEYVKNKQFDGKENECRLVESLMLPISGNPKIKHPSVPSQKHKLLEFKDLKYFGSGRRHRMDEACTSNNSPSHSATDTHHHTNRGSGSADGDDLREVTHQQQGSQLSHGNDKEHLLVGRGCVKLSVYCNFGMLTVHVLESRSLISTWSDKPNVYLRVSLVPDVTNRTKCKTKVHHDNDSPKFDEKFSFELLPEDLSKRLLLSAWHKDTKNSCAEFLGCMSFGIKNIYTQERTISGWYHLLIEEVGRKKHLPVVMTAKSTSSSSQSSASSPLWGRTEDPDSTNDSSEKVPCMLEDDKDDKMSVRSEWQHLETNPEAVRVFIRRSGLTDSLGIRLTSSTLPVSVSAIEPGSPADVAGLVVRDKLLKINGTMVSHLEPIEIAQVISNCEGDIILELIPAVMDSYEITSLGRV